MSTANAESGIDSEVLADLKAVMERIVNGTPVDSKVSRRIEERADRITEQLRQRHGEINVDQLLQDARDDT